MIPNDQFSLKYPSILSKPKDEAYNVLCIELYIVTSKLDVGLEPWLLGHRGMPIERGGCLAQGREKLN